jgi:hypothetical protein
MSLKITTLCNASLGLTHDKIKEAINNCHNRQKLDYVDLYHMAVFYNMPVFLKMSQLKLIYYMRLAWDVISSRHNLQRDFSKCWQCNVCKKQSQIRQEKSFKGIIIPYSFTHHGFSVPAAKPLAYSTVW